MPLVKTLVIGIISITSDIPPTQPLREETGMEMGRSSVLVGAEKLGMVCVFSIGKLLSSLRPSGISPLVSDGYPDSNTGSLRVRLS